MDYKEPNIEIIELLWTDVICTSRLDENEEGDGDSGSIGDWL